MTRLLGFLPLVDGVKNAVSTPFGATATLASGATVSNRSASSSDMTRFAENVGQSARSVSSTSLA
jgi:hypothetical protein